MEPGEKRIFNYRAADNSVQQVVGTILSTDRITADGHQVIDVEFPDKVRKYSAQHIGEANRI